MKIELKFLKRGLFIPFLTTQLLCSFGNFCFAQTKDTTKVIEIAIIDFLYVWGKTGIARELEKEVFVPGIDRALNLVGMSDYKFKIKRVARGRLNYFVRTEAERQVGITFYDIAIWGHVTPFKQVEDNAFLLDYNLQLMIFTNPSKLKECLFYYEMEIRDGRIRRWNNKLCDLPETGIALIPGILCYKLKAFFENGTLFTTNTVEFNIKEKLLPLMANFPIDGIIAWHPEQDCDTHGTFGSLLFEFEDGEDLLVPLDSSLYMVIAENIGKDPYTYNWPISEESVIAMDLPGSKRKKMPDISTPPIIPGGKHKPAKDKTPKDEKSVPDGYPAKKSSKKALFIGGGIAATIIITIILVR